MATITVYLDNPGEEISIKIDDKALLGLFTDSAAHTQGLKDLEKRINLVCGAGFLFITSGFSLISALVVVL